MATNFYKQGGAYYTTAGQKILNPTELQGYAKAGGKEIQMPNAIPTGATKISGPSGLQGLNESQLFRQGQDIYKLPSVSKTLTSDQVTGSIPDVQATSQAENYLPNYVAGQNKYMEMVMSDLSTAQEDVKRQEELATKTQTKLGDLYEQAGLKGTEYTSELEKYNYGANVSQLQEINRQIASKNAEFEQAINAQEGRAGMAGSIYGRQALIKRQQASQIGALSSMAQALQGNITLAQQTAKDAIDIKYSSIENEIEQTKSQIESIYEQLDRADKKKADAQLLALNERTRVLEEQKEKDNQINEIMLSAAQGGATVDTLNKIMNSKTLGEAIINSGQYIQTSTTDNWSTFTDTTTGETKLINKNTGEVKSTGSGNLGEPVGEISGLPAYDTRTANPGVNRSDRNNNPGNIKVSEYSKGFDGVIGVESNPAQDGGNFLIFDSPESGINAIGRLLLEGKSYKGVTAERAIKIYNGGGAYGAADLGLIPNGDFQEQISDPNKLKFVASEIARLEGFTGGVRPSNTAQDYAKLIQDGKMKIENVPEKERDAVVAALSTIPSEQDTELDLVAKEKAQIASTLKSHNGLSNAVGTIKLGRFAPFQWGQKADFIASVEQLVSDLSLESLIDAKSRGATFGALSDSEMRILASAATKIGTWRQRDKDGNVTGYKASESAFKNELDNISKIFIRAVKGTTLNQSNNTTQTSTPIMTGKTPGGMGYQVIE